MNQISSYIIKKIVIFIPAVNRKALVVNTLKSLEKNSVFDMENIYIKVLGESNDGTKENIKLRYGKGVDFSSYVDNGIYDALGQELVKLDDTYVTWLGAGDIWLENALKEVNRMINLNSYWFMGLPTLIDHDWNIRQIYPFRNYNRRLIFEGFYNGKQLPFIQQESTVWHSSLHSLIDWDYFRNLRYAGDYYLWKNFSQKTHLQTVDRHIGAYLVHDDSLSRNNYGEYLIEIKNFTEKTILGRLLGIQEKQKLFSAKYLVRKPN
jgi:hypothetical protein